jgi:hypothetical protein
MTTSSIYTRKVRGTGETLTIGLCTELDIDNSDDAAYKYATVCEAHGTFVLSKNRQLAYTTTGAEFCDECREAQAEATPSREEEINKARTVDTEVARLWSLFHAANDELMRQKGYLNEALETRKGLNSWSRVDSINWKRNEERIPALEAAVEALLPVVSAAREAAQAYDEAHYEGWQRFFLVKHIHSNMHCSSFRWNTKIGWLPDVSGLTEAEAVAAHGETLCTICFPSAPTELTTKQVDPSICTEGRNYDGPSRSGYMSGNWGTCNCGQSISMTSTGNLRKHKKP